MTIGLCERHIYVISYGQKPQYNDHDNLDRTLKRLIVMIDADWFYQRRQYHHDNQCSITISANQSDHDNQRSIC
ncbi:MAG: hypothetical protein DRR16_21245 [Candidatus Parabeggiatoa sp. nov. 3]|nr:MAG: hypothetical protein DRR00_23735 [Gammaproteobacteria bacterium]RKZ58352.1 MAG: hypothetical protein DRQ99_25570 [Gammaproteobacteria bacterium]RKZ81818.1 MAG: hypothetical protein DRR16_21245 [Gammaproteobacteria bacterium]